MHPISTDNGVALAGHDTVALQRSGKAALGSKSHTHEWRGATWWFANDENRASFAADPEAFAPAFGGHCSFAMSLGKLEPGNPKQASVVGDRLYLNSNPVAKVLWRLIPGRIRAGENAWKAANQRA